MRSLEMIRRRSTALAALVLLLLSGCASSVTTVLLVRHAERDPGWDPPLIAAGLERAQALVDVVEEAGVSVIYTTQLLRTQQTAKPLAEHLGLTPLVFERSWDPTAHIRELAEDILTRQQGKTVLVIGHWSTVPEIIRALGIDSPPTFSRSEYDHFFILSRKGDAPARLIRARYGQ